MRRVPAPLLALLAVPLLYVAWTSQDTLWGGGCAALITALSWHWLFLINVIPGVLTALLAFAFLPRGRMQLALLADLDWVSLALVALVFGVINALLGPLLKFLSCPLILLTLGVFTIVVLCRQSVRELFESTTGTAVPKPDRSRG